MDMVFWWDYNLKDFLFFGFSTSSIIIFTTICAGWFALSLFLEWFKLLQAKVKQKRIKATQLHLHRLCPTESDLEEQSEAEGLGRLREFIIASDEPQPSTSKSDPSTRIIFIEPQASTSGGYSGSSGAISSVGEGSGGIDGDSSSSSSSGGGDVAAVTVEDQDVVVDDDVVVVDVDVDDDAADVDDDAVVVVDENEDVVDEDAVNNIVVDKAKINNDVNDDDDDDDEDDYDEDEPQPSTSKAPDSKKVPPSTASIGIQTGPHIIRRTLQALTPIVTSRKDKVRRLLYDVFFWSTQNILGYMVMLAVMMYNGYIAVAIILGSTLGYFVFGPQIIKINIENCQAMRGTYCMADCEEPGEDVEKIRLHRLIKSQTANPEDSKETLQ